MRGIIRELEKENRSLKKELRRFEKYERGSQDDERKYDSEDTYPEMEVKKLTKECRECGKGVVTETLEIMGKCYGTCNTCGYNERLK